MVASREGPRQGTGSASPGGPVQIGVVRVAATAIVVVWGGILVIAQLERTLAPELRWWGHAFVHLWTAAWATVIATRAARARRSRRALGGALGLVVAAVTVLAAAAAVTNLLEMVGAHPALRAFHDAVHRVGAPVGWLLLANLILIALLGRGRSIAPR
jgi:hypothetical protein